MPSWRVELQRLMRRLLLSGDVTILRHLFAFVEVKTCNGDLSTVGVPSASGVASRNAKSARLTPFEISARLSHRANRHADWPERPAKQNNGGQGFDFASGRRSRGFTIESNQRGEELYVLLLHQQTGRAWSMSDMAIYQQPRRCNDYRIQFRKRNECRIPSNSLRIRSSSELLIILIVPGSYAPALVCVSRISMS